MTAFTSERSHLLDRSAPPARLASDALILEPRVWPSLGLVTQASTGAHADMDYTLLCVSAHSLEPYFRESVRIGLSQTERSDRAFEILRVAGRQAEQTMLQATGGVNTHKGCVYLFGLLLFSWARVLQRRLARPELGRPLVTASELLAEAYAAAGPSALLELRARPTRLSETYGEWACRRHGAQGIRGIVTGGFAPLRRALRWFMCNTGLPLRIRLSWIRCLFLSECEDTNLMHRAGVDRARALARSAHNALRVGGPATHDGRAALQELDELMVRRRWSAAASGDMTAASIFLISMAEHGYISWA